MSELIVLKHPNGYFGSLKVGEDMTITKDGRVVLRTSFPKPKNADELYKVLSQMGKWENSEKFRESWEKILNSDEQKDGQEYYDPAAWE